MITFAIMVFTVILHISTERGIHRLLPLDMGPTSSFASSLEITLDALDVFTRNRLAKVLVVTGPPGSSDTISRHFYRQRDLVTVCVDTPANLFQPALPSHGGVLIVDATLWPHHIFVHAYRALQELSRTQPLWAVVLIVTASHVDAIVPMLWIDWQDGRWICRSRRVTHRPV